MIEEVVRVDVSVVVPVLNEARLIAELLAQLAEQDYPANAFEILVVDGGSTDGTQDIVRQWTLSHPNVALFDNPKRRSSAARNIGIQKSRGAIVLVVDGHCHIESRRMLRAVAEAFHDPSVTCVGRPQPLEHPHTTPMGNVIAAARRSRLGHHPESHIYSTDLQPYPCRAISVGVAYRRGVFETIGLFDEQFDAAEDCEFNHRIDREGMKTLLVPEAAVRYAPRESLVALARQMIRYGRGRTQLAMKHPETLSLAGLAPMGLVAWFAAGGALIPMGLLGLATVWAVALWLFPIAVYIGLVAVEAARLAIEHRDARLAFRIPFVLLTIHLAAGWGEWTGVVKPQCARATKPHTDAPQ